MYVRLTSIEVITKFGLMYFLGILRDAIAKFLFFVFGQNAVKFLGFLLDDVP